MYFLIELARFYTLGSNSWKEIETKYTYREYFVLMGWCSNNEQMFYEGNE